MALSADNGMRRHPVILEVDHAQAHDMPFRGAAQLPGVVPPLLQPPTMEVGARHVVPLLRDRTSGVD
jgi:hypothetical protein